MCRRARDKGVCQLHYLWNLLTERKTCVGLVSLLGPANADPASKSIEDRNRKENMV